MVVLYCVYVVRSGRTSYIYKSKARRTLVGSATQVHLRDRPPVISATVGLAVTLSALWPTCRSYTQSTPVLYMIIVGFLAGLAGCDQRESSQTGFSVYKCQ